MNSAAFLSKKGVFSVQTLNVLIFINLIDPVQQTKELELVHGPRHFMLVRRLTNIWSAVSRRIRPVRGNSTSSIT